jgi:hypothetical protein
MSDVIHPTYQHFEVPRQHRSALVVPSLKEVIQSLAPRESTWDDSNLEFCGSCLLTVRQEALREVLDLAVRFTSAYRSVELPAAAQLRPLILSGHQPELFHAGVWYKNFLLSELAGRSGGVAINFLVDNDDCRTTSIRVPGLQPDRSVVARSVPYDQSQVIVPWEMRRVVSWVCLESFSTRVTEALHPESPSSLLTEMWPDVVGTAREVDRLGLALARGRHLLEQRIGLETLEVPLSRLVSTRAFARFSVQLLSELPRLQEVYNRQLYDYRAVHQIRSQAHPVPVLEQQAGWLEAPWWVYHDEAPERQKLWVQLRDDQLILSDQAGWQAVISGRLDCEAAASQWLDILAVGTRLRPRALLTTMFLRMIVADMFVHGIGGGKYDQLTDAIIREFFGVDPPPMCVATATLRLPIARQTEPTADDQSFGESSEQLRQRIWALKYHAESIADELGDEARRLADRKRDLLRRIPPHGEKWEWHREITAVNGRLKELASPEIAKAKGQLEQVARQERHAQILYSREYSYCLFPRDEIVPALSALAGIKDHSDAS